jgi:hypothetical protein
MERNMTTLFSDATTRDPLDFNRTPAWCVELLIPELGQPRTILDAGCGDGAIGKVLRQRLHMPRIDGIEVDAYRSHSARELLMGGGSGTFAYDTVWHGDYGQFSAASDMLGAAAYDLIISNPPFGLAALDFLKCALARVRLGGTVAFLLPTHWDQDVDDLCGENAPQTKDRELYKQRRAHEQFARQRFLDSIRLPDGREGYAKLAIVGGGKNPCRPAFRGGSSTATDRYAWFMFGEPWAGQPSRRLHAIPLPEKNA